MPSRIAGLKSGGNFSSDIVTLKQLPEFVMESLEAYIGCVAGASLKDDYLALIADAGFEDVQVLKETGFPAEMAQQIPGAEAVPIEELQDIANFVASITVGPIKLCPFIIGTMAALILLGIVL